MTVPRPLRSVSARDVVHESRRPESMRLGKWVITPPDRTFVDLGRCLGLVDLVCAGDALVRQKRCTTDSLIAQAGRRLGTILARQAAAYVRPFVDAPTETRTRLLIVFAGLPEPGTGFNLHDENGRWVARPDLDYRDYKIAIEYDGRHHFDDPRQRTRDIARRTAYARLGWKVVEVTADRLANDAYGVLLEVLAALRERSHPRVPSRLSNSWRGLV